MLIAMLVYIPAFVFHYGFCFAFWQRKFPTVSDEDYHRDMRNSLTASFVWPISLLVLFTMDIPFRYGLKFK